VQERPPPEEEECLVRGRVAHSEISHGTAIGTLYYTKKRAEDGDERAKRLHSCLGMSREFWLF
jgi:hypothetical protein